MAALDSTMPTLLDLSKLTGPDGKLTPLSKIVPILNKVDLLFPRIRWMPANSRFSHRSTYDTELPEGDFAGVNGFTLPSVGTTAQSEDGLADYQDYSKVDIRLAEASGNVAEYRRIHDSKHMQGAVHKFMRTWFYGNSKTVRKEFTGLSARYAAKFGAGSTQTAENIILGGGLQNQNDCTSIWVLNLGEMAGVAGIYQPNTMAGFQITDRDRYTEQNSSGAMRETFLTHYRWSCGQTLPDWRGCARIANIDVGQLTAAGTGANDTDLLAKIRLAVDMLNPSVDGETFICGNREVMQWVNQQALKTARGTTITFETMGGKALTMVCGLPFLRCDSITSAETGMATS